MKYLIYFLSILTFFSCQTTKYSATSEKKIALVDLRTPEEFSEGSAEGAMNIPIENFDNNIEELNQYDEIVLFCRSGRKSGIAYEKLKEAGFANVTNAGTYLDVIEQQQK